MTVITTQDKKAVHDEVRRLYTLASQYFCRDFAVPTVSFRRSGRNAGTAFLHQNRINFHPVLFSENRADYFTEVIPHEISHLLTWQLFGKVKPHGKEWQAVMRDVFGVTPETTHSFDMSSVNLNTVDYQCGCGDVALTIRRHNKVLQGVQYRCRKCNEILNIKD